MTGLALALDMDRLTLLQYTERAKKKKLSAVESRVPQNCDLKNSPNFFGLEQSW